MLSLDELETKSRPIEVLSTSCFHMFHRVREFLVEWDTWWRVSATTSEIPWFEVSLFRSFVALCVISSSMFSERDMTVKIWWQHTFGMSWKFLQMQLCENLPPSRIDMPYWRHTTFIRAYGANLERPGYIKKVKIQVLLYPHVDKLLLRRLGRILNLKQSHDVALESIIFDIMNCIYVENQECMKSSSTTSNTNTSLIFLKIYGLKSVEVTVQKKSIAKLRRLVEELLKLDVHVSNTIGYVCNFKDKGRVVSYSKHCLDINMLDHRLYLNLLTMINVNRAKKWFNFPGKEDMYY